MSLARLGLDDLASPEEVREAYRRLAQRAHPDKGGTTEGFQELQRWYHDALQELDAGPGQARLDPLSKDPCPVCRGEGKVPVSSGFSTMMWPCEACHGTGESSK